jgi:integrase
MYVKHEKIYREENTVEMKEYALKKFQILNDMALDKISNIDIQKCVDMMVKEKLSRRTIVNYLSMIHAMFNASVDQYNILRYNPVKKIKLPEEKQTTEKTALTEVEYESLLSKIKNYKIYLITLLAGSCGLRIGEILGLSRDDLNEQNLTLTIEKQYKRVGKNTKHGSGTLKTKNSYRTIPISTRVLTAIKKYEAEYPINIDGRIFNLTNTSSVASLLSKNYKSLGYNISVHELRHTYATLLISKNVDFKTVAKLMGHSVQETIRTYSHVTDEMMDKATMTIRSIF